MSVTSGIISDRYQCRGYTVIFFTLVGLVGFIMFYGMLKQSLKQGDLSNACMSPASRSDYVRYASLFFPVSGVFCPAPSLTTWISNNSAPYTRRATTIALVTLATQVGGILATWLLGYLSPPPDYTVVTITFIVMSIIMVLFSVVNLVYLRRENQLKAKRRERMNKEDEPDGLGDRSAWFIYNL